MTTSPGNKIKILADLWMEYRNHAEFEEFFNYADLGLPLAYCVSSGIVGSTVDLDEIFEETFELLLAALGVSDEGYESIEEVLGNGNEVSPEQQNAPSNTVSPGINLRELFGNRS